MTLTEKYRRDGVLLVEIDERFVLLDREQEKVHIINGPGARIWADLGASTSMPEALVPAVASFVGELGELGLLAASPGNESVPNVNAAVDAAPRLLATVPLQVAANNSAASADPFWEDIN